MFRISYWILPVFAGLVWLGMLLGLLLGWLVADHGKRYPNMKVTQHVAYISDVGASRLQPMFIACSCVTVVALDLSFLADRWLRHRGRLTPNGSTGQKVLGILTIVFAVAGAVGLILLSIFDVAHHKKMHDGFLLLFLGGYVLSAICICWEYQRLGIHNRDVRILRVSFWIKLTFVLVEIILAIAFVVQTFTHKPNGGAIVEWIVAFVFSFYVLSFAVDLYPAVRTRRPRFKPGGLHAYAGPSPTAEPDSGGYYTAATSTAGGSASGPRPLSAFEMEDVRPSDRYEYDGAYGQSASRATRPPRRNILSGEFSEAASNGTAASGAPAAAAANRTETPSPVYQPARAYGHRQQLSDSM